MVDGDRVRKDLISESMGRVKYSDKERNVIIRKFVHCTSQIILTEGVNQVSIRKVAQAAGMNSATIYLYFSGSDELITLACMGYLEDYCRTMMEEIPRMPNIHDAYMRAWEVFSIHAYQKPQVFRRLFFCPHTMSLKETAERYYEIYPERMAASEGVMHDTLLAGTLPDRNIKMLRIMCEEMGIREPYIHMINDFTVCYFKKELEECPQGLTAEQAASRSATLLQALEYLISGPRAEQK